jgi:hypothetical protein
MNYSANKMAAMHCLSAQCIVVDIVPLIIKDAAQPDPVEFLVRTPQAATLIFMSDYGAQQRRNGLFT